MTVEVVAWNPRRPMAPGRLGRLLPGGRRMNNFGDLLGPVIVEKMLAAAGQEASNAPARRLLTVGSILRLARQGDTVWGSGVNGKSLDGTYEFTRLDVRAVRGPLTAEFLRRRGIYVPEVYGDPALLVGHCWSRAELAAGRHHRKLVVIPNFNDFPSFEQHGHDVVNPRSPLFDVLGAIAASDFVVGSSLHAIVVAESLGIPARLISSQAEPIFKYRDYYLGSGRTDCLPARDVNQALEMGGETPPSWDAEALRAAFPYDLWTQPLSA